MIGDIVPIEWPVFELIFQTIQNGLPGALEVFASLCPRITLTPPEVFHLVFRASIISFANAMFDQRRLLFAGARAYKRRPNPMNRAPGIDVAGSSRDRGPDRSVTA